MTSTDNGLTLIYKNMLNLTENITNNNNGIILLKDIIFYKNLFISGTTTINDISLNSTLSIVGNINTNNIYINTNICSNNYINHSILCISEIAI